MLPGEGPEPEVLPVRMGQSKDADSRFWILAHVFPAQAAP